MKKTGLCFLIIGGICLVDHGIGVEVTQPVTSHISAIEIAVGSTNTVKIQAVKNALHDDSICVLPCAALSYVRP